MTDSPVEMLKAARAKIEDPAHWCRGHLARDDSGSPTHYSDASAVQWDAIGASLLSADAAGTSVDGPLEALNEAAKALGWCAEDDCNSASSTLNDTTNHLTVMKMFDQAILLAEQDAKSATPTQEQ